MEKLYIGKIKPKWKGTFNENSKYQRNDYFRKDNKIYCCTKDSLGNFPDNASFFELVAQGISDLSNKGDLITKTDNGTEGFPIGAENQFLKVINGGLQWANQLGRASCSVESIAQGNVLTSSKTSCFLMNDGTIKACGAGESGINGSGVNLNENLPQAVSIYPETAPKKSFKRIFKAHHQFYAITENGDCYSWGQNDYGELGLGDTNNRPYACLVSYFKDNNISIKEVIAPRNSTFHNSQVYFLTEDAEVYACGYNNYGQLGDGTTTQRLIPVKCGTLTNIKKLVASASQYTSVFALDNEGFVWSWGYNQHGIQGHGDSTTRYAPAKIQGLLNIIDIEATCGDSTASGTSLNANAIAIDEEGFIYTVGDNGYGQLGLGDTIDRRIFTKLSGGFPKAKEIYCSGGFYGFLGFVDENDELWAWGNNTKGNLGLEDTTNRYAPTKITADFQGNIEKVYMRGELSYNFMIVLDKNGVLWGAGYNGYGQLARGWTLSDNPKFTIMHICKPYNQIQILDLQFFADSTGVGVFILLSTGEVFACGYNETYGMLGTDCVSLNKTNMFQQVLF